MIIRSNREFRKEYHNLGKGDCILGELNLKRCEEGIFLDLAERGVTLFPPALSQQLSRSKCLQATVYNPLMVPGTEVIKSRHELVTYMGSVGIEQDRRFITKQNDLDCGLGINLWQNIEDLFNAVCFGGLEYPFVIQPFIPDATDIRVIIIENYTEAYWRKNRASFRNNMHFGGESGPVTLNTEQERLCRKAMERGKFPYAHIDLLVTAEKESFISEISLRGGIRGAQITPSDYLKKTKAAQERFAASFRA